MRGSVVGLLAELDVHSVEAAPEDPSDWTIRGEPLTDDQLEVVCDAEGEEFAEAFRLVERAGALAREAYRELDVFMARHRGPSELGWGLAVRRMPAMEHALARVLVDVVIGFGERSAADPALRTWKVRRGELLALRRELDWRARQLGEVEKGA